MLKGISPLLSPELLHILAAMGHGDELVLADTNFPGPGLAQRLVRADGHSATALVEAILPLFPLDSYDAPLAMMAVVSGDVQDPAVENDYRRVIERYEPDAARERVTRIERFAFYERARKAYAVVMTGESRPYGNLILKKGCVR